jgi:hypothetical protein
LVVSFFFLLNKSNGFGGGGGPACCVGCLVDPLVCGVLLLAVLLSLTEVSFLCFLNGLIFLNNSPGGGGGGGPPAGGGGGWLCEKAWVETHKNEKNNGIITRCFSFAE